MRTDVPCLEAALYLGAPASLFWRVAALSWSSHLHYFRLQNFLTSEFRSLASSSVSEKIRTSVLHFALRLLGCDGEKYCKRFINWLQKGNWLLCNPEISQFQSLIVKWVLQGCTSPSINFLSALRISDTVTKSFNFISTAGSCTLH
jgi:hypothetical protein